MAINRISLSRLAYEGIRDSITLPNSDFDYYAFTRGEYKTNNDYTLQQENVFSAINLAIARLTDYEKLPTKIGFTKPLYDEQRYMYIVIPENAKQLLNIKFDNYNASFRELKRQRLTYMTCEYNFNDQSLYAEIEDEEEITIGQGYALANIQYSEDLKHAPYVDDITVVFTDTKHVGRKTYYKIEILSGSKKFLKYIKKANIINHRAMIMGKIGPVSLKAAMFEVREEIPHFDIDDIVAVTQDDEVVDNNIDLREFGIDSAIFSYLKEFIKGQIYETIDPAIASEHNARAENYFQDLPTYTTGLYQTNVRRVL